MLPSWCLSRTLPATLITKRSPISAPKICSGTTLESAQQTTIAYGCCPFSAVSFSLAVSTTSIYFLFPSSSLMRISFLICFVLFFFSHFSRAFPQPLLFFSPSLQAFLSPISYHDGFFISTHPVAPARIRSTKTQSANQLAYPSSLKTFPCIFSFLSDIIHTVE